MATLFNTKISATYEGLLKTIDNAAISATLRELTDGSGNQSGLYLNTAGDFKVTNVLEWGSLKDTGTGVTITQFVTSTDGIENFNNNTTLPTSAAVKLYVDTKFSQTDTLTEVLGFGNTTSGKDILVSAGDDITFTNSSKAIFGSSSDLQISHDGINGFIYNSNTLNITGDRVFLKYTDGTHFLKAENDAVQIQHNNQTVIQTTDTGVNVTGNLIVTGTITGAGGSFLPLAGGTMTGNIVLNDNVKTIYGDGSNLEIFHNGINDFIISKGTYNIFEANNHIFRNPASNEDYAKFIGNGAVELYYNGTKKFETTNTGVNITGALSTTTNISVGANASFGDNGRALFGTSNDLQIYHDGSNSYVRDVGTGRLWIDSNGQGVSIISDGGAGTPMAHFYKDAAVELYYNNVKRLETLTDGAKVTGNLEVTGTITGAGGSFLPLIGGTMTGDTIHNDNVKSIYGTASDGLEIYHNGSNSYIDEVGTGSLYFRTNGSAIYLQDIIGNPMAQFTDGGGSFLMYNGNLKFATTNTGISVTGNGAFSGSVLLTGTSKVSFDLDKLQLYHNGAGIIRNTTQGLYIDQAAVTESIFFRVSDANALDTTALTISRNGDLTTGRNVTIAGDLTVNGTTTTVNSQTLSVDDPLISLAINNAANSLDIGYYGKYNNGTTRYLGLYNDASDSNKFKLFKGTTVEPTTTVDIGGAGYVAADLQVAGLEATTGTFTGDVIIQSATPKISIIDTDAGDSFSINNFTGNFVIKNDTDNLDPLVINGAGNATFAGSVTAGDYRSPSGDTIYITSGLDWRFRSTSGAEKMRIEAGGNVGIGTDSPSAKLHIQESSDPTSSVSGLKLSSNASAGNNYLPAIEWSYGLNGTPSFAKIEAIRALGTGGILTLSTATTSSVMTERMRIDSSGNVGIGTDGPLKTLSVNGGDIAVNNSNSFIVGGAITGNTQIGELGADSGQLRLLTESSRDIKFASTTYGNIMLLEGTNGNVGIGTDSPADKLDVAGGAIISNNLTLGETSDGGTVRFARGGDGVPSSEIGYDGTENFNLSYSNFGGGGYHTFLTNDGTIQERMRITNAGNVGIGTTNPLYKLQVGDNGVGDGNIAMKANGTGADSGAELTFNMAVGGGNANSYIAQIVPISYDSLASNNNSLNFKVGNWNNNADAGASKMSILSSGNVGIGTTSPDAKLDVAVTDSSSMLKLTRTGSASFSTLISDIGEGAAQLWFNADTDDTGFIFRPRDSSGNPINAFFIAPSGNVGIGTNSPSALLDVSSNNTPTIRITNTLQSSSNYTIGAFEFYSEDASTPGGARVLSSILCDNNQGSAVPNGELVFKTAVGGGSGAAATERMRITSGGNVLIGTDSTNPESGFSVLETSGGTNILIDHLNGTATGTAFAIFRYNQSVIGSITQNGTSQVQYNVSSDYRLKEDLQDFAGLDMVSKIPVYDYKWKVDESRSYGVMAHELQDVLPDAVSGEKDAEEMQGVDYSKIVPLLIKSIQELKAEIDILKAK